MTRWQQRADARAYASEQNYAYAHILFPLEDWEKLIVIFRISDGPQRGPGGRPDSQADQRLLAAAQMLAGADAQHILAINRNVIAIHAERE
jgi:hypothetical protein